MIKPEIFEACLIKWMQQVQKVTEGDVLAIDGKVLRGSYDNNKGYSAICMVSAWSTLNGAVLGQIKTDSKSNEITAIPELLSMLNRKKCIITLDAAGCQKAITRKIVKADADDVIALKGNQPTLYQSAQEHFEDLLESKKEKLNFYSTSEKKGGRIDNRNYYVFEDVDE